MTIIFCSASLLAIHDLGPWPKGKTKNGWDCLYRGCPFNHLSGRNLLGWAK